MTAGGGNTNRNPMPGITSHQEEGASCQREREGEMKMRFSSQHPTQMDEGGLTGARLGTK